MIFLLAVYIILKCCNVKNRTFDEGCMVRYYIKVAKVNFCVLSWGMENVVGISLLTCN